MKTVALFLCLLSVRLFAANPSFNDFNANQFSTTGNKVAIKPGALITNLGIASTISGVLSSNAGGTLITITNLPGFNGVTNGYTTNVPPQAIDNQFSPVLNLTYGAYSNTIVTRSNVTVTSSPFTNQNLGNNSVLIGTATVQGASNFVDSSITSGLLVGRAAASNGVNRISASGANALVGVVSGAGTNEAASTGAALTIGFASGGLNRADGSAALVVGRANGGGTNLNSGVGIVSGFTAAGGLNLQSGQGLVFGNSSNTGTNENTGTAGVLVGLTQSGGWNKISGAPVFLLGLANKGTNLASGSPSFLAGYSTDTNTLTASGNNSFLFGKASQTFGSAAATADNSFFIGSGFTNSTSNSFMVAYGQSNQLTHTSLGLGIGTNATTAGIPFELNGSGHVSKDFHVDGFLEASHGSLTMCTGIVTVATSQSTNLINNIWSYAHLDAPLGIETNTLFVVTNAAHFFISFGAAVSANASGSGTISLHVSTNGVLCDSILFFEAPSQGASTYETGFKEFAIDLPAMCRVGLWVGETTAQSVNLKNVCFNMKGGN